MNISDVRQFEHRAFGQMDISDAEIQAAAARGMAFSCDQWDYERKFIAAKCVIEKSIVDFPKSGVRMSMTGGPGGAYGAWFFEANVGSAPAMRLYDLDLAWDQVLLALKRQRKDGYFPYVMADEWGMEHHIGWATLAREIYELDALRPDRDRLEWAYERALKWTRWVQKYRDSNNDGIYESFHEFDIGVDRDPRYLMNETVWFTHDEKWVPEPAGDSVQDLPMQDLTKSNEQRLEPVKDWSAGQLMRGAYISAVTGRLMQAQLMLKAAQERSAGLEPALTRGLQTRAPLSCRLHHLLPYSSPEVNSMVYCDLVYLAKIADKLGRSAESAKLAGEAEELRERVNAYLWHPEDHCYYDKDRHGNWIKINSDAQMRALNCGLPTNDMAEVMFTEHILNPDRFWTPFPLPSVAADDEAHLPNGDSAWHGPTLCLTPTRAFRAFKNYGYDDDLIEMARRIVRHIAARATFPQQWNPHTGKPGCVDLAPAMECSAYVYTHYVAMLCGVIPRAENQIEWNCFGLPGVNETEYKQYFNGRTYRLNGQHGRWTGYVDGKMIPDVADGAIVITDTQGGHKP